MGQKCSTQGENVCTIDNYRTIKIKRLKDTEGDKIGTMKFVDDYGKDKNMKHIVKYIDVKK